MTQFIEVNATITYQFPDSDEIDKSKVNIEHVQSYAISNGCIDWEVEDIIKVNSVEYRNDNS